MTASTNSYFYMNVNVSIKKKAVIGKMWLHQYIILLRVACYVNSGATLLCVQAASVIIINLHFTFH